MMSEFWTTVRKAQLKRLWEVEKLSHKQCAAELGGGCTVGMIAGKIRVLGLIKERELVWHERRVAILKQMWTDGVSCRLIAVELKCTPRAVEQKARSLGLSRRYSSPMHDDIEVVKERKPRVGTGVITPAPPARRMEAVTPHVVSKSRIDTLFIKREGPKTKSEMMAMLREAVENTK